MDDLKYKYRVDSTKYVVMLLFFGVLATFLGGAAGGSAFAPFLPLETRRPTSAEVVVFQWLLCAASWLITAYAYFKLYFDKSSYGYIHLTNSSITIPISRSGKSVRVPYKSMQRMHLSSSYFSGRAINIWYKNGSIAISSRLLVDDDIEKIYSHMALKVKN